MIITLLVNSLKISMWQRGNLLPLFGSLFLLIGSSFLWGETLNISIRVVWGYLLVSLLGLFVYPLFKDIKNVSLFSFSLSKVFGLFLFSFIPWTLGFVFSFKLSVGLQVFSFFILSLIPFYFYFYKKNKVINVNEILEIEGQSLFFFAIFMAIYSFHPDLYGGEKPMDFNLLGYLNESTRLPVEDPWAFGNKLKYYYFSYFSFSSVNKLIGLPVTVLYPFALSLTYSLLASVLTLYFDVIKIRFFRFLCTSLILLGGIFYGPYLYFIKGQPLDQTFFWNQTRLFSNHFFAEFTSWSAFFADLHPHVSSLPYALSFLYLVSLFLKNKILDYLHLTIMSLLLGSLLVLNSWDLIIYLYFTCALFLYFFIIDKDKRPFYLYSFILLGVISILSELPSFLILRTGKQLSFGFNQVFHSAWSQILFLGTSPFIFLVAFIANRKEKKKREQSDLCLLSAMSILVILINIFYFMDQINTWFKVYTNIYILFCIISLRFYLTLDFFKTSTGKLFFVLPLSLSFLATGLNLYSLKTYQLVKELTPSLNGIKYLKHYSPEEYEVIQYLNNWLPDKKNKERLVTAYGTSFDYQTIRVPTFSHIPTYLGWTGHLEVRGTSLMEITKRVRNIDMIYKSTDAIGIYEKLRRLGITLVLVGPIEYKKYHKEGLQKFESYESFFRPLIKVKNTTLYQVIH